MMKKYIPILLLYILPLFAFAQNGGELCNQDTAQLRYYKGFYQRTEYISSSTYNAKMGDPSYRSAFYWLAVPFTSTVDDRWLSVDACAYRGSLHLGEGSACTEVTQLDANNSCVSGPGVNAYYDGIPAGNTYVIELNTKGRGGVDEDGGTNLIWEWAYNGPEACDTPSVTGIAVDNSANTATITFTNSDGSAPSGTYEVYLLSEFDETETVDLPVLGSPTQTVTSSPFTLTNLTPNTSYRLWMSKSCGSGMGSGFGIYDVDYIDTTDYGNAASGTVCDAIALTVGVKANPYDQYMDSSAMLETNEPVPSCFSGFAYNSMWFTFVAPPTGNVLISTDIENSNLIDSEMALYAQPSSCSDLTTFGAALACDNDSGVQGEGKLSVIEHTGLTPGDTYYIQVTGFQGGAFGIEVLELAGDVASEALAIDVDAVAVNFDMASATLSTSANSCSITALKDAWVKFVTPSSGNVLLELITNNNATAYLELYDFVSGVYTALGICVANSLGIGIQPSSSGLSFRPLTSSTKLTAGNTYFVRIVQEDGSPFASFSLKASNPSTLGTKEIENKDVLMYPNPTKDMLFFKTEEQIDEVIVFDLAGKERAKHLPINNSISLKSLKKGVYLLQFNSDNKAVIKKIVKH